MAMLPDLLKSLIESLNPEGGPAHADGSDVHRLPPEVIDNNQSTGREWTPKQLMQQNDNSFPSTITGDDGMASTNQSNPFMDAIKKSRENNNQGPGLLRQLLGSVIGGQMVPGTGTVGGDPAGISKPDHVPGTQQDAALNPTPMKDQSQLGLRSGLLEKGNIDLNNRPVVQNDDGSISTVHSKSFNFNGKETLLPTISDNGRHLTDEEAIAQYRTTGKHLGIFGDVNSANQYAEKLHQDQAQKYKYAQPSALDPNAIEQLRQSLLGDSGQLDPNNPNGLAGRMTSPNSQVDMNNQRKESMSVEDSVRGFDGVRSAKMKKGN